MSAVLWSTFYWGHLDRVEKVLALGLPCLLLNAVGWLFHCRGSRLNAVVFLSTGSLLLPLLVGVVLTEYELLRAPQVPEWELFESAGRVASGGVAATEGFTPTNVQINVAVGSFLAYALVLLVAVRARVFAAWLGVGIYLAWSALLLLCGMKQWLADEHIARTLPTYLPLCAAFVGLAWLLRRRRWLAALCFAFFPIPAAAIFTLLAYFGAVEWFDVEPAWDHRHVQLWLMGNGVLYLAAAHVLARAAAPYHRRWGEFFMVLAPVSLLVPSNVLFEAEPHLGLLGGVPVGLFEPVAALLSVGLAVLGTRVRRAALVVPGLFGLAVFVLRATDRHFEGTLGWPLTLAILAAVAMGAGVLLAILRSRRAQRRRVSAPSSPGS